MKRQSQDFIALVLDDFGLGLTGMLARTWVQRHMPGNNGLESILRRTDCLEERDWEMRTGVSECFCPEGTE
jgi:hypothetical protein